MSCSSVSAVTSWYTGVTAPFSWMNGIGWPLPLM